MEHMETTSALTLMPSTKEQMEMFANDIISKVECGEIDPLGLKTRLKWIENTIKKIDEGIREEYLTEAGKHEKTFERMGFEISLVETAVKYDYSNDATHTKMKEALKDREKFLKGLTKSVAEEETGELVHPPIKKSTTALKFKML